MKGRCSSPEPSVGRASLSMTGSGAKGRVGRFLRAGLYSLRSRSLFESPPKVTIPTAAPPVGVADQERGMHGGGWGFCRAIPRGHRVGIILFASATNNACICKSTALWSDHQQQGCYFMTSTAPHTPEAPTVWNISLHRIDDMMRLVRACLERVMNSSRIGGRPCEASEG